MNKVIKEWLDNPSRDNLEKIAQDFPEVELLRNNPENTKYHQEKTTLEHVFLVIQEMVELCKKENITCERYKILMLASLSHDILKPMTLKWNEKKQNWCNYGHDTLFPEYGGKFLERIGINVDSYEYSAILKLVRWHMLHTQKSFSVKFVRKLKRELFPAKLEDLIVLMTADCRGKIPRTELPESIVTLQGLWALEKDA